MYAEKSDVHSGSAAKVTAPPAKGLRDSVNGIKDWLDANAGLRSRNAALYFPRVDIADPLNGFRLRPSASSGTIAGIYAQIDGTRGVWKAPAGTEATLGGVQQLEYKLTDGENGVLNPLAINCLRQFPVYGPVCWGARTLAGADQMADDYESMSRSGAWRCSLKRACFGAPSGLCSSRTTNLCGRRSG